MAKARKAKQLSFTLNDRSGLLSEVTGALSAAKVNISAICAYAMERSAYFMLSTESNPKAKKALALLDTSIEEEDVVAVEMSNRTGELEKVANRIGGAGINIYYMYGTAGVGRTSICIFKTSDDKKAIRLINK
ncbi:MAG: ACT domain-containing protein [Nitrospirae bacterium]|nr:ACT domain-containing protein [Nitrospirota bacterium]